MTRAAQPSTRPTAALRDASWFANPDTTSTKKYHVVVGDLAACNQKPLFQASFPLAIDITSIPADEVPQSLRCRRPGCRVRWPS